MAERLNKPRSRVENNNKREIRFILSASMREFTVCTVVS